MKCLNDKQHANINCSIIPLRKCIRICVGGHFSVDIMKLLSKSEFSVFRIMDIFAGSIYSGANS